MNRCRPHHKIYGASLDCSAPASDSLDSLRARSESGYALVALLAVMTLLALFALAVAPGIRQQVQREQEKEAIFRGEQIADAIRSYYINRIQTTGNRLEQSLPSSMDQLVEGVTIPGRTKKLQILRASAARDPLSLAGEWGYVRPRSQRLIEFQRQVTLYAGGVPPRPTNQQIIELQTFSAPLIVSVLGIESTSSTSSSSEEPDAASGPFVGVTSRSGRNSVLYYYGIDQHNEWVFTPLFR